VQEKVANCIDLANPVADGNPGAPTVAELTGSVGTPMILLNIYRVGQNQIYTVHIR
jgi:hypothetical protein